MELQGVDESPVRVRVENIGGISEASVEFSPGITVLTGRNATNRTSFLRALMAAIGSDEAAVKGDAEEGSVELTVDSDTYTRDLRRRNGTTVFDGNPYLEDAEVADLFAFLLESNDARRAVEQGTDLYDIIMQPVDTAEIDEEIDTLERKRDHLESELDELEALNKRLPDLEQQRSRLESDIDAKRDALGSKREQLETLDVDSGTPEKFESRFEELRETRNDLEGVRTDIEDQERIIEALEEDKQSVEADLDGLAAVDEHELADLEGIIAEHRDAIQSIESALSDLQSVIQFNESLIKGDVPSILDSLGEERGAESAGSVTDKLTAEGDEVVCWTCGSRVERSEIERTIDLLRDVHTEEIDQRNVLREEINELETERKHIERTEEEHRRLRERLGEINSELEVRASRIEDLEADAERLEAAISDLDSEIADLETDDYDELLAQHRQVNQTEFELDRLEARLDEVNEEIGSIEARLKDRERIEAQRADIDEEIEALRTRIERLESEAVEQFDEQMETILDLLEYENLERIWIERVSREEKQGRRTEQRTAFDLHVVRTTESGSVYEDTVDHLSESEREVVGLVFALSGYLVHEMYEQMPFMLLDSVEAFDSDRISALVDHFAQYADYLVVALLPEDAAALDDEYQRIAEI